MNIDVRKAPPAQVEIDDARRSVDVDQTRYGKALLVGLFVVIMLFVAREYFALSGWYVFPLLVMAAATWLMCMVVSFSHFCGEWHHLRTLDDMACESMYQTCEKTAEGKAYRLSVVAQGRKFINAEASAMQAWSLGRDVRASVAKLYGSGEEDDGELCR